MFSATIISRSSSSLLSQLKRIKSQHFSKTNTSLFALSCPSESSELSVLVDTLVTFSPVSVGCLSASLAPGFISCSIAALDSETVTPFRSIVPGKEKTQVGRWHAFRRKDEKQREDIVWPQGSVDWNNIWKEKSRVDELPQELSSLNAADVSSVLYLSDLSPEGFSSAISEAFPSASQLGLLASSTPFITGRPVTLFHNQQIYDTGAVGVALKGPLRSLGFQLPDDIQPLGDPLNVTDSEGNLVNSLDLSNPTQLLLSRIRAAGIDTTTSGAMSFKDDMEFYLGVLYQSGSPDQLHIITAGDTSRGTLSLNTQTVAPPVGSRVQFFHRRSTKPLSLATWKNASLHDDMIAFTALSPESMTGGRGKGESGKEFILEHCFVAGSENGLVLGRPGESPWSCTAPGCISYL
ncbi:hypothetical protein GYMLUDRAFT_533491 [Collybiopsis luxurians FD-317 M1]|nr:hypothetical protein GYMLUDRAFT_533491 [Collybiopsis luxurians FD-317 M1]